jgi:two-component system response regulator
MSTDANLRILLVDDDGAELERTHDALRRSGLAERLLVAHGGQEALDYLFGRGQFYARRRFPLPALILLDLNMPVIDGHAVLRQIRGCDELRRIPVIVLCTSESEGERAMEHAARANGYLVKPVTFESLASLERQVGNWTLRLDLPEPRYAASRRECTTIPPCSRIEWNWMFGQISFAAFSSRACVYSTAGASTTSWATR